METPKGLKEWLAIPENQKRRLEAIAKNKAVREARARAKETGETDMEYVERLFKERDAFEKKKAVELAALKAKRDSQYQPRSAKENLLTLALSAQRAHTNFPPELLDLVKGFTKKIPVIKRLANGSYPVSIFDITGGKLNNFSNFLPYVSFEDFQKYFPQITKTMWAQGRFLTKTYHSRMIVSNNGKEALIFLNFNRYFLPEQLQDFTPNKDFVFISKYIPVAHSRNYGGQEIYPLEVIRDKDIPMVKKFLGVK